MNFTTETASVATEDSGSRTCESGKPLHETYAAHAMRDGLALCEICSYDAAIVELRKARANGWAA